MQTQDPVRFRFPRDVGIGLLFIVLTVLYWRSANTIPISPLDGIVNAAAMPKALAVAMVSFCVILILRALAVEWLFVRAARAAAVKAVTGKSMPERPEAGEKDGTLRDHLRAVGMLGLGLGYLLILPWLGYILSMILLVTAVALFIGSRSIPYTLGVAVATSGVFYLLFVQVLDIPLPPGIWPSFLG